MKYKWTVVGLLLAIVIGRGRPPFLIAGMLLGYAIDRGWLGGSLSKPPDKTWSESELTAKDPYQILEVDPQASDDEIEAAYRRQIAQYHPDKVAGAAKEIRELAEKRATDINAAYDQIQKIRGKK
jgi:preprotein translocase subunit Sec63